MKTYKNLKPLTTSDLFLVSKKDEALMRKYNALIRFADKAKTVQQGCVNGDLVDIEFIKGSYVRGTRNKIVIDFDAFNRVDTIVITDARQLKFDREFRIIEVMGY